MEVLLTADEMRTVELAALDSGFPELLMMEHAALAVAMAIEERFAGVLSLTRGLVMAGPGRNGGDAMAVARLLAYKGASVEIVQWGEVKAPASQVQRAVLLARGIPISSDWPVVCDFDWVVDGLFGTGLTRSVEGKVRSWVERLSQLKPHPWIVAVDIPSGLDADSGEVRGVAVCADATVTFGHLKRGLVTGEAANYVGELRLDPIQLCGRPAPSVFLAERSDIQFPKRRAAGHKGLYGHAKIWCGPQERQGAAILAAQAALRTGVGLVSLIGYEEDLNNIVDRIAPEIMVEPWRGTLNATAVAVGPGMGVTRGDILRELLFQSAPLVMDADALTVFSKDPASYLSVIKARRLPTIMTPHPKEAARLLGNRSLNRFEQAKTIQEETGCVVCLKGKGSIISIPGEQWVVREGNSALSRGGSGDMLTGILAGLLAQGLPVKQALIAGVFLEGETAERLTQTRGSDRSITVSEMSCALAEVMDEFRS